MDEQQQASPRRTTDDTEPRTPTLPVARIAATPAGALRCPYCHGELARDLLVARCEACRTAHHASCFGERGACSVHGCRGRAAHVSTISGRTERQTFAPCRACQAAIFLDERAALCRKCDSAHHPSCLESRGSCARCGSRDATLMGASEFARATEDVKRLHARSSMPALATGVVLVAAGAGALLVGSKEISVVLLGCAIAEFILGYAVYTRAARVATVLSPAPSDARGRRT